jgi:uncharacterized damage-inducible protein DinB
MSFSEILLSEYDHEMASTRKILAAMPEENFGWKPHEKSMTLGRLASHVAEMPSWAEGTLTTEKLVIGPDFKPFNAATKPEILEFFDKSVAAGRAALAAASDEDLSKNWELEFGGHVIISMPRTAVLRTMVMNHMIHHRGQLSVYLRLNEAPCPGMYGPSADDKLQ